MMASSETIAPKNAMMPTMPSTNAAIALAAAARRRGASGARLPNGYCGTPAPYSGGVAGTGPPTPDGGGARQVRAGAAGAVLSLIVGNRSQGQPLERTTHADAHALTIAVALGVGGTPLVEGHQLLHDRVVCAARHLDSLERRGQVDAVTGAQDAVGRTRRRRVVRDHTDDHQQHADRSEPGHETPREPGSLVLLDRGRRGRIGGSAGCAGRPVRFGDRQLGVVPSTSVGVAQHVPCLVHPCHSVGRRVTVAIGMCGASSATERVAELDGVASRSTPRTS